MRLVWQLIAGLVLLGVAQVCADSRHDNLDATKHPPEHFYVNGNRPPGSLILTMLTKDEASNLNVTLPKWAKVIDYWVIGIDEDNTDNSPEIIRQHVGHIPGEIVTVHFDGMGPTWTKLTDKGWELFPEGTHGIVADADYVPTDRMIANFDKHDLHIGANKLLYKLWNDPNAVSDVRKMDWIYRNMPGVKVTRRVHQTVTAPPFFSTDSIRVEEAHSIDILELGGGYQLRTMSSRGRNIRYIKLLELDLQDLPNDPRTLYYLADSHRGVFMAGYNENNVTKEDWNHLDTSIKYYKKRLAVPAPRNNFEETYFTMIAVAELSERFLQDYSEGFKYYQKAFEFDPERADPQFYIGQRKRLNGDLKGSLKPLLTAARMKPPVRSVFQWVAMYDCISTVELARTVHSLLTSEGYSDALTYSTVKEVHALLNRKANSNKGCEFHREAEYARDGLRLASALADYVQRGPPAGDKGSPPPASTKPRAAARKKYSKPGAAAHTKPAQSVPSVEMSSMLNTERPRGGQYFNSDKYGMLTHFEPQGGSWAFQHPMGEADMGLGYTTQRKRELGVSGADKARVTTQSFAQQMSVVDDSGSSFTVGTAQWNHGVHKVQSTGTSMPSAADKARTGTRRMAAASRAVLAEIADHLQGWVLSPADATVLEDTVAMHDAPPQTFLPTSPLSPAYNPRSDNRGRVVEGTAAAPGYDGEGAQIVYKPGEAPAAGASGAQSSSKARKRRQGGPRRNAASTGSTEETTFEKVRNPLAPRPKEPMRDFLRRITPGGVAPGNTRVRSQASAFRHSPLPQREADSFWGNEFGNVALNALQRTKTRLRFLKEVVDSPPHAVSCADFRQQVVLLESMLSSGGFEGAPHKLSAGASLGNKLSAARQDVCFQIAA